MPPPPAPSPYGEYGSFDSFQTCSSAGYAVSPPPSVHPGLGNWGPPTAATPGKLPGMSTERPEPCGPPPQSDAPESPDDAMYVMPSRFAAVPFSSRMSAS